MHLPEGVDYGYKGGIPGLYDEKGKLIKKAEDLTPQQLSDFEREPVFLMEILIPFFKLFLIRISISPPSINFDIPCFIAFSTCV